MSDDTRLILYFLFAVLGLVCLVGYGLADRRKK